MFFRQALHQFRSGKNRLCDPRRMPCPDLLPATFRPARPPAAALSEVTFPLRLETAKRIHLVS